MTAAAGRAPQQVRVALHNQWTNGTVVSRQGPGMFVLWEVAR